MHLLKYNNIMTKKFAKFINLNSNFIYFNIREDKLNKKLGNIIFKKKLALKIKLNKNITLKVKKVNTNNLKYNSIFNVEKSFLDYKQKSNKFLNINTKNENLFLNFLLIKEIIHSNLNKKKQFLYFLNDFVLILFKDVENLYLKDNIIQNQLTNKTNKFFNLQIKQKNNFFFNKYLSFTLLGSSTSFFKQNVNQIIFINNVKPFLLESYINNYFFNNLTNKKENKINKNILNEIFLFSTLKLKNWLYAYKNNSWNKYLNEYTLINWKNYNLLNNVKSIIRKNKYKSFLLGKNFINLKMLSHFKLISKTKKIKQTNLQLNKSVWKNNNHISDKNFLNTFSSLLPIKRNLYNTNKTYINKTKNANNVVSKHLLYLLTRLEDKIDLLSEIQSSKAVILLKLYNYLKFLIIEKNTNLNISNKLLCNNEDIINIKKSTWKNIFKSEIEKLVTNNHHINILNFAKKIMFTFKYLNNKSKYSKEEFIIKNTREKNKNAWLSTINDQYNLNFKSDVKFKYKQTQLKDKIHFKDNYTKFKTNKNALGLLINKKINLFFINSLALTKYGFNLQRRLNEKQVRNPTLYLQNIDRDMINKYKYVGIYIKDLIRICFIGMFLKKPNFIAKFIAFQLAKLPRNRKETQFIKFIVKVVKTFAAEREEITGLRIKFKGRVNRWRRTKSITGERGILPLHEFDTHIEYGTAYAINKKGTLGIRLWLRYNPSFIFNPKPWINFNYSYLAKETIFRYIKYSQKRKEILNNLKLLAYKNKLKRSDIQIENNFTKNINKEKW